MNWMLFIGLTGVGSISYLLYLFLMNRQVIKLTKLLYQEHNAKGFLKELDSWMTKLFFPKKVCSMMQIDALMMLGETEKLKLLFEELNGYKIKSGDEFIIRQKELAFYVDLKDEKKSTVVYERLCNIFDSMKNKTKYEIQRKESEYIYEINIKKNYHYLEEMLDHAANAKTDFSKGIYLYRAAKCYYYKKENRLCKDTLQRAQTYLKGSFYEKFIQDILDKDLTLIEQK